MPSAQLSAGKLEKKLYRLEEKLRAEFAEEFERLIAKDRQRLEELELRIGAERHIKEAWVPSHSDEAPDAAGESGLGRTGASTSVKNSDEAPDAAGESGLGRTGTSTSVKSAVPTAVMPCEGGAVETVAVQKRIYDSMYTGEAGEDYHYVTIPFFESAWNLVLVTGNAKAYTIDMVTAYFVFILSVGMQILFTVVVVSPDFLGKRIDSEQSKVDAAAWRASSAHDSLHMNSNVSLATRVCAGDSSLTISTSQSDVIQKIDSYLGFSSDFNHENFLGSPSLLARGPALCILCILLWTLYMCSELRSIITTSWAISRVPLSRVTSIEKGRLESISWGRACIFYLLQVLRTILCGCLLYAGVRWLCSTTSTERLILETVALGAILEVDGIAFAALLPESFKNSIQDLEAIRVRYTRWRSQVESITLITLVAVTCILSVALLLQPLLVDMKDVKALFCAGPQNFVVKENPATGTFHMLETSPVVSSDSSMLGSAIDAFVRSGNFSAPHVFLQAATFPSFELAASQSLLSLTSSFDTHWECEDSPPGSKDREQYAIFETVKARLGITHASRCEDLQDHCGREENGLLRFLCPHTCGCDDPLGNRFYRTPTHGCLPGCQQIALLRASQRACVDRSPGALGDGWVNFWYEFGKLTVRRFGPGPTEDYFNELIPNFLEYGCKTLEYVPADPATGTSFCEGGQDFAGLKSLCPDTCGCLQDLRAADCPRSCGQCEDRKPALHRDCEALLVSDSWKCYADPDTISTCARSCKLCACVDAEREDIPDQISNCSTVYKGGYCEQAFAKKYCKQTCGYCKPACADMPLSELPVEFFEVASNCSEAKASGLCIHEDAETFCAATCGFCSTGLSNVTS